MLPMLVTPLDKMTIKTPTKRVLSLVRTVFFVALVLAVVAAGTLWLTLQYKPAWYRQAIVERMSPKRARAEAIQLADTIGDSLVARQPTEIKLSDRGVTGWLAVMPSLMPQGQYSLPHGVSALAVRFDEAGFIQVGASVDQKGFRVILSVSIRIELVKQGQYIRMALDQANGGALHLPKALLEKVLNQFLQSEMVSRVSDKNDRSRSIDTFAKARTVDEWYEGVLIPNRFVWPNGDRPFKVDRLTFSDSMLTIQIQPMP